METNSQQNPPPQNPLDQPQMTPGKAPEPELVENILAASDKEEEKLLDVAPTVDKSLLLEDHKEEVDYVLMTIKGLFWLLVLLGVSSFLFFSTQLRSWFAFVNKDLGVPNYAETLANTNLNVLNLQTEINFYRYLMGKGALDNISYLGDDFLQNYSMFTSQTSSSSQKSAAESAMTALKSDLSENFQVARDDLLKPITTNLYGQANDPAATLEQTFSDALTAKLTAQADTVNTVDATAQNDYKHFMNTVALVGNTQLMELLKNADFEAMNNDEIAILIGKINGAVINDLSLIQQIKQQRIKWSDVIDEIDKRTIDADKYYSKSLFNDLGGVRYTSYDFDSKSRKVSLTGETKTFDTKNFSLIINLIDALNASDMFDGVEMRSFSKSGSIAEGYTASIRFTLNLIDPNAPAQPVADSQQITNQ